MDFWLGLHGVHWVAQTGVPVMVSHRRLRHRRTLPVPQGPWVLDSGGFTELRLHGGWTQSARDYAITTRRYRAEMGEPAWIAPQDWMCEPFMLARTGRTVAEHQRLTIENFLELQALDVPVIPVLQGWAMSDYEAHVEAYAQAGVDLAAVPLVGLGSVCRRQDTGIGERIVRQLASIGLRLHGFGMKITGLRAFGDALASADSMAWSVRARWAQTPLPDCRHPGTCANCLPFALRWRDQVLANLQRPQQAAWAW